jgi:hypothetical protein
MLGANGIHPPTSFQPYPGFVGLQWPDQGILKRDFSFETLSEKAGMSGEKFV